ncbi:hypothetical protein M1M34_gp104 [Haloarcula tailed virus 2]|uniref:Uncharacterized protein n=1 Tax=Haloarcula tailed virus 2 TaxID=2877989 RepID=A0AAE9BYT0_9CAUD|nr:hypothetical protein M1M34_gp104 [Haloarcula tailed virus 2]UBF23229.1 hypothetical protein HATV-2_gp78 [Haloarcula tailed virus 2]
MRIEKAVATCLCGKDFSGRTSDSVTVGDTNVTFENHCSFCKHDTVVKKNRKGTPRIIYFTYLPTEAL